MREVRREIGKALEVLLQAVQHAVQLLRQIGQIHLPTLALGLRLREAPDRHEALKAAMRELYACRLQQHGVEDVTAGLALLALDVELNAQGLAVWLDRPAR